MNRSLRELIQTFREELLEYGELLARLDGLNAAAPARPAATDASWLVEQKETVRKVKQRRRAAQRVLAEKLQLRDQASLTGMLLLLPENYRPLITALAEETGRLRKVIGERMQQDWQFARRQRLHEDPLIEPCIRRKFGQGHPLAGPRICSSAPPSQKVIP